MKYIKLFEGFDDREKLRDDISNCLIDLYDQDFDIIVSISKNTIFVEIKKQENEFMFDVIENEVEQLCDYMNEKYKKLEINYLIENEWTSYSYDSFDEIPEDVIFSDIIGFNLWFTNKNGFIK